MSAKDQKPKPQGQKPAERPEIQEEHGSLFYTFIWALAIVFISVVLAHYATTENASMHTFTDWVKSLLPEGKKESPSPFNQKEIKRKSGTKMITQEELAKNNGKDGNPTWISILGQVFDVSSKPQHYGPEGGYSFFAGRDGTRAFATGDFSPEGLTPDIVGLSYIEVIGIWDWLRNYKRDYDRVGYLIGHYYTPEGTPSEALLAARKYYAEGRKIEKEEKDNTTPGCNLEWNDRKGTRVYCEDGSGGVTRGWKGVLRKIYKRSDRAEECVCVHPDQARKEDHTGKFKFYELCPRMATSCAWGLDGKVYESSTE